MHVLGNSRDAAKNPTDILTRCSQTPVFAGGLRSGQLFMAGCIRGRYKRRLLQTLNSPYINQTPTRCAAPLESEREKERNRVKRVTLRAAFLPVASRARDASSSTRMQQILRSMHSTEHYMNTCIRRKHAQIPTISFRRDARLLIYFSIELSSRDEIRTIGIICTRRLSNLIIKIDTGLIISNQKLIRIY